jgi:thymidylate synthase
MELNNTVDKEYFRLINLILENGRLKKNRTGIDTTGVFGAQAKFNVDMDAFPILTTKKVFFKGIVHELLWFIKGDTNIKYLVDNDVHIWDEWAYKKACLGKEVANECRGLSQEGFIKKIKDNAVFAKKWGELGEGTYGGMWRAFPYSVDEIYENGHGKTITGTVDQLKKVVDKLKTNPDDRRMIVSAWHPYHVDYCALPPCHCLFNFNTEELTIEERCHILYQRFPNWSAHEGDEMGFKVHDIPTRRLNCLLYQRSTDSALGLPYNITSYCLLTAMIAHCVNMEPGVFTHTYGDLHIYNGHMDGLKEQMNRTHKRLPKLWLNPSVKSLFDFKFEDVKLIGYDSHPTIKFDVAV